jgi:hypothetical protein
MSNHLPAPAASLIVASALSLFLAAGAHAATRTVPTDFAVIQDALDASSPGDTVAIRPGDYLESLTVRDDLVIVGSGADSTRIRGFSDATLTVDSLRTGVVIRDLALRAAPGVVTTVQLRPGSAPLLSNVVIDGGTVGLRSQAASPRIESSLIHSCTIGVSAEGAGSPVFLDDGVSDNLLGVSVSNGSTPEFHRCRFERNGIYNLQVSSYSGAAIIDASRNWWGSADESAILLRFRFDGSGPVSVIYVPWCGVPGCTTTPVEGMTWGGLRTRFVLP